MPVVHCADRPGGVRGSRGSTVSAPRSAVRSEHSLATVDGHPLTLSNLSKVLYPAVPLTKADVISYYVDVAPVMLPHLRDRPVTLRRFPGGVGRPSFFQKHVPRGAPAWVRTFRVPRSGQPGSEDIVAMVVCDPATLVWAANLAALELHVPMWRGGRPGRYGLVDLMVFDLDPGPSTSIVECCQVVQWLRHVLEPGGLVPLPKTSGSKGLQLYVPLRPGRPWELVRTQARDIARQVGDRHPDLVVTTMAKERREAKVLIDWSQNHPAKTTVAPYSLRALPRPTVSTPVTWAEVDRCASSGRPQDLAFECTDVTARIAELGDLFAPLVE